METMVLFGSNSLGGVPVDFIPIVEIAVEVRDIPDVERVQPFCSSDFV